MPNKLQRAGFIQRFSFTQVDYITNKVTSEGTLSNCIHIDALLCVG